MDEIHYQPYQKISLMIVFSEFILWLDIANY